MKTTAEALEAYDALYKSPITGEHIIDGDEAQVAADLAALVRAVQGAPQKPTEFVTEGGCTVRVYQTEDDQTMLSLVVDDGVASFQVGDKTITVRQALLKLTPKDLANLRWALA